MKKSFFTLALIVVALTVISHAQTNVFPTSGSVGIGTTAPDASAILEMQTTTKGLLVPRMTKTQRDAIVAPANGLLIYQTNASPGFYFYTGGAWQSLASKGPNKTLSNLQPTAINQSLVPNAGGTLDLGTAANTWDDVYTQKVQFPSGEQMVPFNPDYMDFNITPTDDIAINLGSPTKRFSGVFTEGIYFADGTTQYTAGGGGGAETDPQVGANTVDFIPRWNGSALTSGMLQDNNTSVFIGSSLYSLGSKMSVENTSTTRNLYLVNGLTGTGTQEGLRVWLQSFSTGTKAGISNSVWQSNSGTGTIYGVNQDIQKYGTGTGYGLYNTFDILGASTNYGSYTNMIGGTGTMTGQYINLNNSGSQYGVYTLMGNSTGTHIGYYVSSTGTDGSHYGLFSQVSTANTAAYSAYLVGKVYASGNVGIGTSSPATKLHVEGGTDAALGSGGYITTGATNSTNIAIDNNEIMARNNGLASTLYLNNDGGNISMCYAGGNVMIGASVPAAGYLLSVDGKVMCEELKVLMSESWPDYVFGDAYHLPTLYEVEASIKQNKHLPGIPSAEEVEKNGIAVGEMQVKMMEKIEELTLYVIELQKQIDELNGQH
ncbi:MAG: hypothetical protein R2794_13125 [Chitinophagales bacterium]